MGGRGGGGGGDGGDGGKGGGGGGGDGGAAGGWHDACFPVPAKTKLRPLPSPLPSGETL